MEKLIKPMLEEIYKQNSKWAIVLQDDSVQLHSVTGIMTAVCVTLAVCYSSAMKMQGISPANPDQSPNCQSLPQQNFVNLF